jgi:hypothetical protein
MGFLEHSFCWSVAAIPDVFQQEQTQHQSESWLDLSNSYLSMILWLDLFMLCRGKLEEASAMICLGIQIVLVHVITMLIFGCHIWIACHLVIKYDSCLCTYLSAYSWLYMHICIFIHCCLFFFWKENAKPGRKSVLDDALFQFFRKEVV